MMGAMAIELSRVNRGFASVRLAFWICVVATLLALAAATDASAAPGDLDPTFGGGDGLVSTAFGDDSQARAVAVQPSGKIVAAGGRKDFDVARYNADGSPDTDFSGDGKLTTDFGYEEEGANAVAIQPNGKIVVAGEAGPLFALARYNADGTPDTSFSGDGKVTTDFPETEFDAANALVLQPNGKLVAAGMAWPDTESPTFIALARYESDGTLDTGFGKDEDGLVVTGFPESEGDVANALLLRPNGKLVAVGTVHDPPNGIGRGEVGLVQYDTDGSLDDKFGGGDGMASARSVTQATSAALTPSGQIVVAGGFQDFLTGRFESDGSVDTGYDGTGALFPGWHGEGRLAYAVAAQKNGRVIAAGTIQDEETGEVDYAVARYETDGSLDTSFGGDGMVTTEFEESKNGARAIALQTDGKIVVAGGAPDGFGVIRYEGDAPPPEAPEQPEEKSAPPSAGSPGATTPPTKASPKKKRAHRRCRKAKHQGTTSKKTKRKCRGHHHHHHRSRPAF